LGFPLGLSLPFASCSFAPIACSRQWPWRAFGADTLHPAIVVTLQAAIIDVTLAAFTKFAVVSLLGTAAAFVIAHLAGQVPGLRAALGAACGREASLVSEGE
jgi:hypothetical protein